MRKGSVISAVIPARNEEAAVGSVLQALPDWVDDVVVVDNGSTDRTAQRASTNGARVVLEPRLGYGAACLAGLNALTSSDIVLFLDADYSDFPEEADRLVDPVAEDRQDMVIGSRVRGGPEAGALTPQARFGNRLACRLMTLVWKKRFTDLGPFRAIDRSALAALQMTDKGYGWTVEMQARAVACGLRVDEVPVSYRPRIGRSKISGTITGACSAGVKILYVIAREALFSRFSKRDVAGTDEV